jgi:exosome complex component RRP40
MKVVLPGDELEPPKGPAGTGIRRREDNRFVATQYGTLHISPTIFVAHATMRRYTPNEGDNIIGIITERHAENYRVDINSYQDACLPSLSFENATKRHKPNLAIGSLVYARVLCAHKDMETELSCVSEQGKSEGLGELTGGMMISCSLSLAHRLLHENDLLLNIGERVPFEIAIGLNGRLWIKTTKIQMVSWILGILKFAGERPLSNKKSLKRHIAATWKQLDL